ncbi:ABC transporter substrate-binding protein [Ensifer sp. YR511]|uniref:ABC transporter substrate-binding protein n=1 Tax=Ensifer sp. YR511 TaxID=1855294 RepID=UPI0008922CBF|nr:extracellular solute-binding protein [Ensifer sp. YR511]SDN75794.1 iron(III) transport system substrate-binding protein [Ensifer sp. YR511]
MKRRQFILSASALGASAFFPARMSAQTQAFPAFYPAGYQVIVEGSKAEQPLLIYTTFATSNWAPIIKHFREKYPWIEVSVLDLNPREALERYRTERGANSRSADLLYINAPEIWSELSADKEILVYKSPEDASLEGWAKPLPGVYAATLSAEIYMWNKLLLPENLVPTGLKDLYEKAKANPDIFNGRICTYNAPASVYYSLVVYQMVKHHGEQIWEWLDFLGPMTKLESGGAAAAEKLYSGEYIFTYNHNLTNGVAADRDPNKHQLAGWGFFKDGTPVGARFGAVSAGTRSPNSSKLMLDFVVSFDGQKAVAEGGREAYHSRIKQGDVPGWTYDGIKKEVPSDQLVYVKYDPSERAEFEKTIERWKKAHHV